MTSSIQKMQSDLSIVRRDLALIKNILSENYELSDYAKKALKNARKTPKKDYVNL